MLLSSFFARSMAFTHTPKVQLPFALFSETFLTIRQNSLYVTVCIIARPSYRGYFIHSLSTLHYCNAPSLATRLTGDYRDRTFTGKCGPASLDTRDKKRPSTFRIVRPVNGLIFGIYFSKLAGGEQHFMLFADGKSTRDRRTSVARECSSLDGTK